MVQDHHVVRIWWELGGYGIEAILYVMRIVRLKRSSLLNMSSKAWSPYLASNYELFIGEVHSFSASRLAPVPESDPFPRWGWIFSFLLVSVSIAFLVLTTLGQCRVGGNGKYGLGRWRSEGNRGREREIEMFPLWNTNMWIEYCAWKCCLYVLMKSMNMIENLDWTIKQRGKIQCISGSKAQRDWVEGSHQISSIKP